MCQCSRMQLQTPEGENQKKKQLEGDSTPGLHCPPRQDQEKRIEPEDDAVDVQINEKKLYRSYRSILKMPQPAHLGAVLAAVTSALLLLPSEDEGGGGGGAFLPAFVYIFTFAAQVGTQIWMTFVAGILLFFRVERRTFGQVQVILFPAYFLLNGLLGLVSAAAFLRLHPESSGQALALGMSSMWQLGARLFVAPPMLRTMERRAALEKSFGLEKRVGRLGPKDLPPCQKYMELRRRFMRLHSAAATANLAALACNAFHLCYLADKIAQL